VANAGGDKKNEEINNERPGGSGACMGRWDVKGKKGSKGHDRSFGAGGLGWGVNSLHWKYHMEGRRLYESKKGRDTIQN